MEALSTNGEPRLSPIKSGWAAHGIGWAVHAPTREEAIRKYHETEALYREIDARPYLKADEIKSGQNNNRRH